MVGRVQKEQVGIAGSGSADVELVVGEARLVQLQSDHCQNLSLRIVDV